MPVTDNNFDLFCRINVESDLARDEFITFIACKAQGKADRTSVRNDCLDILVDRNDHFDARKSRAGRDRWLYFQYTLEVDPRRHVATDFYIAAIGSLLKSCWTSRIDAVAACEFEQQLPTNFRRWKWPLGASSFSDRAFVELIENSVAIIPVINDPIAMEATVRVVRHAWPRAQFEDADSGRVFQSEEKIPFGHVREILVYLDPQSQAIWEAGAVEPPPRSMIHLVRTGREVPLAIQDSQAARQWSIVDSIRRKQTDIQRNYAEAA